MTHAQLNKVMKVASKLEKAGKSEQAAKYFNLVADFCGEVLFPEAK